MHGTPYARDPGGFNGQKRDPDKSRCDKSEQAWGMFNWRFTCIWDAEAMEVYKRSPESWIQQIFSAKAVERGAVVRRSVAIVEREIGRERLMREVERRGYHLIECGGQFVIICNSGRIRLLK